MTKETVPPEFLQSLISYNPETGSLTWLPRGNRSFDTKLAGKPAFAQNSKGYLTGRIGSVNLKAHRVAWAIFYGAWPVGLIDHINGNPKNNQIANLRCVTSLENAQNQGVKSNNSSGEPCVSWFKRDRKWQVKITANRKQKHIGFFDNIEAAVAARDRAWAENGFHENHGKR